MLRDKIIVVVGGSGLLGTAFTDELLKNNAKVIVADLKKPEQKKNLDFVKLNITSKNSIQSAVEQVKSKYGKIDGWVNSAYPKNKNYGKEFFDVSLSDFCENINLNIGGNFLCCQTIAKFFVEQGFGNIINIASIYGVVPPTFEIYENTKMTNPVEYAVIKSSIVHLTKYMAKYFKGKQIRVNTISPGGIFDNQD